MTRFLFPWPTSKNKLYGNNKSGVGRGRYLTKDGKSYVNEVQAVALTTRPWNHNRQGPVSVRFTFRPPTVNRVRDSHNGFPILFDSMKRAGIIVDDNDGVVAGGGSWRFGSPCAGGMVIVEVEDFDVGIEGRSE